MNIVLTFSIIAILCTILNSTGVWKYGLLIGFIITTSLLAIHYDYGNDYMAYLDWFESSSTMHLPNSFSEFQELSRAPGWDLLNLLFFKLFGGNGFFAMVAFISIIEGICYYTFIKTNVPVKWYWLAMATYILNVNFFMLSFSMMRQSLVMAILLVCFIWIQHKKIILPLLVMVLLSTIHQSILICIPLVLISYNNILSQKKWSVFLFGCWSLFLLMSSILEPIIQQFTITTQLFTEYLETYAEQNDISYGLGYILALFPFFIILFLLFNNKIAKEHMFLIITWSTSIILIPFCSVAPLIERIIIYFELTTIAIYPAILTYIKSPYLRISLLFIFLLLFCFSFYQNFYNPDSVYYQSYLKFTTIFHL